MIEKLIKTEKWLKILKERKIFHSCVLVGIIGLVFNGFFVSEAFAYIDPGTGSIIIQGLIGALAGLAITLKIYWHKIRSKLIKSNPK